MPVEILNAGTVPGRVGEDIHHCDAVLIASGSRARTITTGDGERLPTLRTPHDLRVLRQAARYGEVSAHRTSFVVVGIGADPEVDWLAGSGSPWTAVC